MAAYRDVDEEEEEEEEALDREEQEAEEPAREELEQPEEPELSDVQLSSADDTEAPDWDTLSPQEPAPDWDSLSKEPPVDWDKLSTTKPDDSTFGAYRRGIRHGIGGTIGGVLGAAVGLPFGGVPAIGTSIVGAGIGSYVQRKAEDFLGIGEDPVQTAADEEKHRYASAVGELTPLALTLGRGNAPALSKVRVLGAGIMSAVDAAMQQFYTGTIDPVKMLLAGALGYATGGFNNPTMRGVVEPVATTVGKALGRDAEQVGANVQKFAAEQPYRPGRPDESEGATAKDNPAKADAETPNTATKAPGASASETPPNTSQTTPAPEGAEEGGATIRVVRSERNLGKGRTTPEGSESGVNELGENEIDPALDAALGDQLGKKAPWTQAPGGSWQRAAAPAEGRAGSELPPGEAETGVPDFLRREKPASRPSTEQTIEPETPAPAPEPAQPGIPFVMTGKMKQDLAGRGFSPDEIRNMTPGQAHEYLAQPAPAPAPAPAPEPAQPSLHWKVQRELANRGVSAEEAARLTPEEVQDRLAQPAPESELPKDVRNQLYKQGIPRERVRTMTPEEAQRILSGEQEAPPPAPPTPKQQVNALYRQAVDHVRNGGEATPEALQSALGVTPEQANTLASRLQRAGLSAPPTVGPGEVPHGSSPSEETPGARPQGKEPPAAGATPGETLSTGKPKSEAARRADDDDVLVGPEPAGAEPPARKPPGGGGGKGPPEEPPETPAPYSEEAPKSGLWGSIQRLFMPGSMSPAGVEGNVIKRAALGTAEQKLAARTERMTNDLHKVMNERGELEQRQILDAAQGGSSFPGYKVSAADKPLVDTLSRTFRDVDNELASMPKDAQQRFYDRYTPGMYKDPEKARAFFDSWTGAKPPTVAQARLAGLEPRAANPFHYMAQQLENVRHFTATENMVTALQKSDLLKYGKPPAYWDPLEPSIAGANAYAPRDIAAVLNNFYSEGLKNAYTKDVYQLARRSQNMYTMFELGLNTYHAFTEMGEGLGTGFANAITRFSSGDMKGAGESLVKALIPLYKPVSYTLQGSRLRKVYSRDASTWTPEQRAVLEPLTRANIKPMRGIEGSPDYEFARGGSFVQSYLRGGLKNDFQDALKDIMGENGWKPQLMFIPNLAGRLLQTVAHPVFQQLIPNMKMGALAEQMHDFLRLNPEASPRDIQIHANKMADSIDNRMGEMVADNMTMRAGLQHAAYLAMRSFSWTIGGPIKEILGGARSGIAGALQGQNRMSMRSPYYDPRVAYAVAFPFTVALMNTMYQKLKSGEWPSDIRDFAYPRTGGHVKSAGGVVPERLTMPGYHKDLLGYVFHPAQELSGKIAGLWTQLGEQISGKDYRTKPWINPDASFGQKLAQRLDHFIQGPEPISIKSWIQGQKRGSNISRPETAFGFRPPGAWVQNPRGLHAIQSREYKATAKSDRRARRQYGN